MKVTNSLGKTYTFTKEEMETIFMYAYGYVDLAERGHLPIELDKEYKHTLTTQKLKQCFREEYEIIEKTIGGKYEKI